MTCDRTPRIMRIGRSWFLLPKATLMQLKPSLLTKITWSTAIGRRRMELFALSALANMRDAAVKDHQETITKWNYLLVATLHTLAPLETGCWAFATMVSFGSGEITVRSMITSPMKVIQKTVLIVQIITANQSPSSGSINKRASKS